MAWFRIVLIVWFGVFAASAFFQAGKGEHTEKLTTLGQLVTAILHVVMLVGVWRWL